MELQKQVVSLELAKRLKELGVKQESIFVWSEPRPDKAPDADTTLVLDRDCNVQLCHKWQDWGDCFEPHAAFTVAELGEMLQDGMMNSHKTGFGYWTCKYTYVSQDAEPTAEARGDTEAEARGLMLVYLIENNLITL